MEYDEDNQDEEEGFFNRLKESPRTVSVLIIILIVAAAIYAFSDDTAPVEELAVTDEETEEMMEPTEGGTGEEMDEADAEEVVAAEEVATPEAVSPQVLAEQNQALPEGEKTDEGYVETAVAGDGLTHLARRAATRYLSENEAGYAVTNEHRIYIEDYIKDQMTGQTLQPGSQVTVSSGLMQEAVASAGELSASQLQNLSQYTYVLN